jgi:hypothetical protein
MQNQSISIIGAGLSGLLASSHFPDSIIYEKSSKGDIKPHRALLRFRTSDIGDHLGIPFKKVTVHKGIWSKGGFKEPNIKLCNQYSTKVANTIDDRSIWNMETCTRFIAPENFHEILLERYNDRIHYEFDFEQERSGLNEDKLISTMPMHKMISCLQHMKADEFKMFKSEKIRIIRYRVKRCDVYQTVYFPDYNNSIYRASLTGNMLIIEMINNDISSSVGAATSEAIAAFGIKYSDQVEFLDETIQENGKFAPIDDEFRKHCIYLLTRDYGVFSLGRYAIWKNVMLDDIWKDIKVIKQLIWKNNYDLSKKNL